MSNLQDRLALAMVERGYSMAVTSIQHLDQLRENIQGLREKGLLDGAFFQNRLSWFDFRIPENLPNCSSLIILAVPRAQSQATFSYEGEKRTLIIPPTYTAYDATTKKVQALLGQILANEGYNLAETSLPLKTLAAWSGLCEYGKNNVCYVSGMGSFLQLVAVYSNMPCSNDRWQEAKVMESCQSCQLCSQACPTGAIPSDRFLLRAERCIVYHNEKEGSVPFPDWMKRSWHNCLVGCLRCQWTCPLNKGLLQWIDEREEFSEEETELLLEGATRDRLSAETIRKLEHLDLMDYLGNLPRNLGVFFGKDVH